MKLNLLSLVAMAFTMSTTSVLFADDHTPTTEADCKEHHGTWDSKTKSCKVEKDSKDHDHRKDEKKK